MKNTENTDKKSNVSKREEETLSFWNTHEIFKKSLELTKDGESFVFYDGPPFATGLPHYGHLLAGTIKDAIPRFETMRGKFVRRKWGWDCHGLPIENIIEDKLGLKNKQDVIEYGLEKFNEAARDTVFTYDAEWKDIVARMGRFIDMEDSYKTMDWQYSESIWWAFKTLHDKGLIYKGYKSMHICPRCETTLSNNEVSDGYKDIKDISITAKFELVDEPGTFVLAWTTTPWTLPGNVALAVGEDIEYVKVKNNESDDWYIVAKEALKSKGMLHGNFLNHQEINKEFKGKDLIGKSYKPVFDYYSNDKNLENRENGWKIYGADFVTTEDGTGVVHIAPAFGEDDMNLGNENNLPFVQHVKMNGEFKKEVTHFAGQKVKPIENHQLADIEIIKHLAHEGFLFSKLKFEHSYPHCWRCKTPLLNYATDSWFVDVMQLKGKMVKENDKAKWVPEAIGRARFGNWIEGARDWAISRSRFWGAPFPVWQCDACEETTVVGSIDEVSDKLPQSGNTYTIIRHGQAENNTEHIVSGKEDSPHHLTDEGKEQVLKATTGLKDKKIDIIISSPFIRTRETTGIITKALGFKDEVVYDARIGEINLGVLEGRPNEEYLGSYTSEEEKFIKEIEGGETLTDVKKRVGEFLYEIDKKYKNKNILIVTHDYATWMMKSVIKGLVRKESAEMKGELYINNAEIFSFEFKAMPHNRNYERDIHRPYIDEVVFDCKCGGKMKRIPEVFDCWFESGSMPYAQLHYPFENKELFDKNYPADFIAEGLDQTRGWFYSLLVLAVGLFDETSYKNVIVNGLVLAEDGKKMSKSLKNYPDPMKVVDEYGADALRYYMISSPIVHAEALNFSEKGVGEVYRKVVVRLENVLSFYEMYKGKLKDTTDTKSENVLDIWILARVNELVKEVTEGFESYQLDKATRPIGEFIDDLSTWYVRRSRSRYKAGDADTDAALKTTKEVLDILARVIAPVMPFLAEHIYDHVGDKEEVESVHLAKWPTVVEGADISKQTLNLMKETRQVVTLALENRAKSGLKVRQPLASLTIKDETLKGELKYLELIKDEVNVKEILFDKTIESQTVLDIELTEELRAEGRFRELVRNIQSTRKKNGLTPEDVVTAHIKTDKDGETLVKDFEEELMKTTLLKAIEFDKAEEGQEITVDGVVYRILLQK